MTKTVRTAADTGLLDADPIIPVARAIEALLVQAEAHDCQSMMMPDMGRTYCERARDEAYDMAEILRSAMTCFEARTMDDAMAQLATGMALVEWFDGASEEEMTREGRRRRDALERLFNSALRFMERAGGHDLVSLGLSNTRRPTRDYWAGPLSCLAAYNAGHAGEA